MSHVEPIDINKSFGAAFCGLVVTAIFYGITSCQTYTYLRAFPNDGASLRALVWSLWVLDTIHVACASHSVYWYVIINYANPPALDECIWSLSVSLGLNVIIAFLVQCFFAKRVWSLGRSNTFTAIVVVFVVTHFGFGITTMAEFMIKQKLSQLPEIKLFPVTPFAITAVGSDIVIAAALCYYLHSVRTGVPRTESLIDTLIVYAIERCILTSFFAIVETILFAASPHTLIFLAIDFFLGKLYANSLLATLNSRTSLGGRGDDEEITSCQAMRDPRTGRKVRREAVPVSLEFTAGSSSAAFDPSSFEADSTPHVLSSSGRDERYKAPPAHDV